MERDTYQSLEKKNTKHAKWVEAKLPGYLSNTWPSEKRHVMDLGGVMGGPKTCGFWCFMCKCQCCCLGKGIINPILKIHNARLFENEEGLTKAEFFEKHGFVLINHVTNMKETDWTNQKAVKDIYNKELEPIIKEILFPKNKIKNIPWANDILRRGPGTSSPFYGLAVHGDYGFGVDEYKKSLDTFSADGDNYSVEKWHTEYEKKDVAGFMVINFWRPVLPMKGPVRKIPLAMCDTVTVKPEDMIKKHLFGFVPGLKKPLWNSSLRFNEDQKWYYYPDMTCNETLVFKQVVLFKDNPEACKMQCFHSAFKDPTTPPNSEVRQSCEYRIPIWFEK